MGRNGMKGMMVVLFWIGRFLWMTNQKSEVPNISPSLPWMFTFWIGWTWRSQLGVVHAMGRSLSKYSNLQPTLQLRQAVASGSKNNRNVLHLNQIPIQLVVLQTRKWQFFTHLYFLHRQEVSGALQRRHLSRFLTWVGISTRRGRFFDFKKSLLGGFLEGPNHVIEIAETQETLGFKL